MIPYARATSGDRARAETVKLLRNFGVSEMAFAENYEQGTLSLAFKFAGKVVNMDVSAQGWANMYLKENPWSSARLRSRVEYEEDAIKQGFIAINSVLRDWVKGQLTAVQTGIVSFEEVFLAHILIKGGQKVIDVVRPQLLTEGSED